MKISSDKKNARKNFAYKKPRTCPHCREDNTNGGHFIPPGFGSPGQWACAAHPDIEEQEAEIQNLRNQEWIDRDKLSQYILDIPTK